MLNVSRTFRTSIPFLSIEVSGVIDYRFENRLDRLFMFILDLPAVKEARRSANIARCTGIILPMRSPELVCEDSCCR